MTIRTVLNPYGGIPPIVDARIGTAYAIVEICVLNLEQITVVSNNVEGLAAIYQNLGAIVNVNNNMAAINALIPYTDEIAALAPHAQAIANINTNMPALLAVHDDLAAINIVASGIVNVDVVANDINNVNTLAADITSVNTVAADIDDVKLVAQRFTAEVTSLVQAVAGAVGATVTLPWPAGVTLAKVRASSVVIKGTNNWLYFPGATTFIVTGKPTGLEVVVQTGATLVVGGQINWHITHTP